MTRLDLDALEKLADEATPGPWTTDSGDGPLDDNAKFQSNAQVLIYSDEDCDIHPVADASCNHSCRTEDEQAANAAFIAAANPATIKALIAELKEERELFSALIFEVFDAITSDGEAQDCKAEELADLVEMARHAYRGGSDDRREAGEEQDRRAPHLDRSRDCDLRKQVASGDAREACLRPSALHRPAFRRCPPNGSSARPGRPCCGSAGKDGPASRDTRSPPARRINQSLRQWSADLHRDPTRQPLHRAGLRKLVHRCGEGSRVAGRTHRARNS